jgi:hypothetical protein
MVHDESGAYHRVSLFIKGSAFPLVISRFVNPAASNGKSGTLMVTQEAAGPTYDEVVDQVVPFCCCDRGAA